jgi:hypothetical protein
LERPKAPDVVLEAAAREGGQLQDATAHGLESLRMLEGLNAKHAPGAITNPAAYADPLRKNAAKLPGFGKVGAGGPSNFGTRGVGFM